jgi:hypothetical protein
MSYAVSALIGIIIGVASIFSPQPTQPDQQKVESHGSQTKDAKQ